MKYSAVVVEYFSGLHLFDCITSLQQQSQTPQKIVVVTNGISQESRKKLEDISDVSIVDPHANLGYARAANLGIASTDTEIVFVVNPDIVVDPECANHALDYLDTHSKVAAVGPRIFEPSGEIYPSARNEPPLIDAVGHGLLGVVAPNNRFSRRYKNLDVDVTEIREVDWLSGAAQFLRREALDDVGGWDEDFFMYCEDVDLGRRLRKNGWTNVYLPDTHLVHEGGGSSKATPISLIITHHRSLYRYVVKKYHGNIFCKLGAALFIGIRLPLALITRLFRIS